MFSEQKNRQIGDEHTNERESERSLEEDESRHTDGRNVRKRQNVDVGQALEEDFERQRVVHDRDSQTTTTCVSQEKTKFRRLLDD